MSLEPAKYSLRAYRGATFRKQITVLSGGDGSLPRNFTGESATLLIKDAEGVALLTLTTGDGITLGGSAGTIEMVITPEQMAAASWASAVYTLTVTNGADTDMFLYGSFTLKSV